MGDVIALAKVYIVLCQPDEGDSTVEEIRQIGRAIMGMGPAFSLLKGSWLVSTMKLPNEITRELSNINRKFSFITFILTKNVSVKDTFSNYGIGAAGEWLEQYLV